MVERRAYVCDENGCEAYFPVDDSDPMVAHGAYMDHQAEHDAELEAGVVEHAAGELPDDHPGMDDLMPRLHVTPKGRVYKLDGEKVPSVTTILNAMPKELKQWAADCAANEAINHWDELGELPLTKRLDRIRFAHRDVVKAAALRGTEIHKHGERLLEGEAPDVPAAFIGPVKAYARFLDAYAVERVAAEVPIAHTVHRYAGRADLFAWITTRKRGRHYSLVDLKSGGNIYAETTLQLAGYSNGDIWQPDGPASEDELPPVEALYVAHILPDDVRLLPVQHRPIDFRHFLYVQQTAAWISAHGYRGDEPLIGDALEAPVLEEAQQ